jgi:hypothetical protein
MGFSTVPAGGNGISNVSCLHIIFFVYIFIPSLYGAVS